MTVRDALQMLMFVLLLMAVVVIFGLDIVLGAGWMN